MSEVDPSKFIDHTISAAEARAGNELADRWLDFAHTRKVTPLVVDIAAALVHVRIAHEAKLHACGSEEESDELFRSLIAIARGAGQS